MASTITINKITDFCSTQAELMPLSGVGGYLNEPALSLANDTLQQLLAYGIPWKFNRVEMPLLVLRSFHQDQQFAGACAFTQSGGVGIALASASGITESGFTVTVNTLDTHDFAVGQTVYMTGNTVAAYNSTFTQNGTLSQWSGGWTILSTPTTKSFTFTHASSGLATSGAPGITDFGWLESATMTDQFDGSALPNIWPVRAVRTLQPSSVSGTPRTISVVSVPSTGVLKIRVSPVPGGTAWGAALVYQAKAPLKTALTDTWAPFPDELSFVYRQAFLARCYRFLDSRRADGEFQKAQAAILLALGHDDSEASEESVSPETSLMGGL